MVFDILKVGGIGEHTLETKKVGEGIDAEEVTTYKRGEKVFLVVGKIR